MKDKFLLCNFIFLMSLVILFLNDHFFKLKFHNWFTGKLSDFAGLAILPFLLAFLFPKLKEQSVVVSALFFIFWKSEFSESFIRFYNTISPIEIHRVVDMTDFVALVILIIPFYYLRYPEKFLVFQLRKIPVALILLPTIFVLMSTSPPRYYYNTPKGNLTFANFDFVMEGKRKDDVLAELNNRKISVHKDTLLVLRQNYYRFLSGTMIEKNLQSEKNLFILNQDSIKAELFKTIAESDRYVIDSLNIGDETLRDIRFYLYSYEDRKKGASTGINITDLRIDKNLSDAKVKRKLRKLSKEALKEKLKME